MDTTPGPGDKTVNKTEKSPVVRKLTVQTSDPPSGQLQSSMGDAMAGKCRAL